MKVGLIGLGRMGEAIAYRLIQGGHEVVGFDLDPQVREKAKEIGVKVAESLEAVPKEARVIWLMVPAGDVVDTVIAKIKPYLKKGDIVIDGGNSHFPDSIRRGKELAKDNIYYLDIGTSGGLNGREIGFSLMVGGDKRAYDSIEELLKAIAAPNGYGYMGPAGAGHYVKMIHNGIEYAIMQAYAEGFDLIKNGRYKDIDLEKVSEVWRNGSVIRSWLLDLAHTIFENDQEFKNISGIIGGGSTGRWTVREAKKQRIPVTLIEDSLKIRDESQKTGGNYATKIVALLRNQFGGHDVEKL